MACCLNSPYNLSYVDWVRGVPCKGPPPSSTRVARTTGELVRLIPTNSHTLDGPTPQIVLASGQKNRRLDSFWRHLERVCAHGVASSTRLDHLAPVLSTRKRCSKRVLGVEPFESSGASTFMTQRARQACLSRRPRS